MSLRAYVKDGRRVVNEPTDLPEGTELDLVIAEEDALDAEDQARLQAALASRCSPKHQPPAPITVSFAGPGIQPAQRRAGTGGADRVTGATATHRASLSQWETLRNDA